MVALAGMGRGFHLAQQRVHFFGAQAAAGADAAVAGERAADFFELFLERERVAEFGQLVGPLAETREFLVPTGMSVDLDEAVQHCVRAAISLLGARYGMEPHLAYAYLSAATDFNISQVVDIVKGVHARIRKSDLD